jgi:hypothetical protein
MLRTEPLRRLRPGGSRSLLRAVAYVRDLEGTASALNMRSRAKAARCGDVPAGGQAIPLLRAQGCWDSFARLRDAILGRYQVGLPHYWCFEENRV